MQSGDLVGPYRLIAPLGAGAMGEVWRARDERLDRHVALKVMTPEVERDVERRSRMLREAKAAAAIRHANVVTLFDIVKHEGDDILVMELVDGRTLSDTLRKDGAPALDVALAWIEGVADALVAAHARGILHRDIKAANVMLTGDGNIKVLDFGLAKLRDDRVVDSIAPRTRRMSKPPEEAALDATIASGTTRPQTTAEREIASYQTHAGQLIGTPLYMAPEQIDGAMPDERSEVFSLGVLAHEILMGKPPYAAVTVDALFKQILEDKPAPLEGIPAAIEAIVLRALAKAPGDRFQTMRALRDAIATARKRRRAPRRWPIVAGALAALAIGGAIAWRVLASRGIPDGPPPRPGDKYVARALEEYDVFYNPKAMASLRAALAIAPDHPLGNAYTILFGYASDVDRTRALDAARRARARSSARTKDRALLDAAIALVESGPRAAGTALAAAGAPTDRELAFWAAELAYRSGDYTAAHDAYQALLAEPAPSFRGRIYDHESSVLLYLDEPTEALRIGKLYRDAYPGEPDAVGVYATTLAAAGKLPEAIAAAEQALALNEGEDTLAGLGKVVALAGDRKRARDLYQRSLDRAEAERRPLRRAALAMLQWADGDTAAAIATTAPCLPGGADATVPQRGACLFVGAVVDPARATVAATELDALAAAGTPAHPAYGSPQQLAALVRARAQFFDGGCVRAPDPAVTDQKLVVDALVVAYTMPVDFYAAYHVPYFATWAVCEHAGLLAQIGHADQARALLKPVAERAPGRDWLRETLRRF